MKRFYYLLFVALVGMFSCQQDAFEEYDMTPQAVLPGDIGMVPIDKPTFTADTDNITLGAHLQNPYSLTNMRRAYDSMSSELIDAGIESDDIKTTHFYVKFKPDSEEELQSIKESYANFDIYEYPLDYELSGRVSYHDPEIPDSLPTYQYASIDSLSWNTIPVPQNVEFEILERLFIPDEDIDDSNISVQSRGTTSYSDAIEALVNRSMLLTGNLEEEDIAENGTMASSSKWYPSGRITAYDDIVDGQIPLEGVKVRVRQWFTTSTTTTDANGYFTIPKSFKNKVNYLIIWEGDKWDIRDGKISQAYYNGPKKEGAWNLEITDDGNKSIRYTAIHRAVYRMKEGETYGIGRIKNSSTTKICYRHKSGEGKNGKYWLELGFNLLPDIDIYGKNNDDTFRAIHEIIATTFHELGHAIHFTNDPVKFALSKEALIESWASFVGFYLVLKEYQDLGYYSGPFNTGTYIIPDVAYVPYYIPDYNINRQLKQVNKTEIYLPIFIDMYDKDNQYITNIKYNPSLITYQIFYSEDSIQYVPADVIQNIVFNSRSILDTKSKLQNFCNSNQSFENEVYKLSTETINLLYLPYMKLTHI